MAQLIDGAVHVWDGTPAAPGHTTAELCETLDGAGIHGAICVQSRRDAGYDHTAAARAIREHPDRLIGICIVDPVSPAGPEELRARVTDQGFSGVRVLPFTDDETPWLDGEIGDPLWDAAAHLGVPVDIICRPEQLGAVHERALRSPDATVVIDHLGLTTAEHDRSHVDQLLRCAELPNVVTKMSALAYLSREEHPYRNIHGMMRDVVSAYGADRVIYGSDWPNILAYGPYEHGITAIDAALDLDDAQRDLLFGGTAARVWNFGGSA